MLEHADLSIRLFGGFRVELADQTVTHFRTRKTAELLAFLAYHRTSYPREELIELLWPDVDPLVGRNRLKQTLTQLRHELEPPEIPAGSNLVADRMTIGLRATAFTTDVWEFKRALQSVAKSTCLADKIEALNRATDIYQGELLPGYYQDWIVQQRQVQLDAYLTALRTLIRLIEQAGDFERALNYAHRALNLDLLREETHQDLMRLFARSGQPFAVARQYDHLERVLRDQLGVGPSDLSRNLLQQYQAEANEAVIAFDRSIRVAAAPPPLSELAVANEAVIALDRSIRVAAALPPLSEPEPAPLSTPQEKVRDGMGHGTLSDDALLAPTVERKVTRLSLVRRTGTEVLRMTIVATLALLFSNRTLHSAFSSSWQGEAAAAQDRVITVCTRNGKAGICSLRPDGSDLRYLSALDSNEFDAVWSPDRTRIAFASDREGKPEIYVMNADGSNVRRLTYNSSTDRYPSWTADSNRIAFVSDRDGVNRTYLMDADGTHVTPLASIPPIDTRSGMPPGDFKAQVHGSR